jgi:hypothetical protein
MRPGAPPRAHTEVIMSEQEYIEKRFDVYVGCYCYGRDHHTGQSSRAYRLLSLIGIKGFKPSLNQVCDSEGSRAMYEKLLSRNY